ncbi:MAG: tryptophan-rich sensory protein [Gammaproteobacteria bacterium]|nr:tryptophan-rich sensory protein [Gammaproteobacteria bacterium]
MTTAPRRPVDIWVAAGAAFSLALLGGLATQLGPWYYGLTQPAWKPPDWAFGPAWTVIYILTATAGVRAWRAAHSKGERKVIVLAFTVNAALNLLWSILFFSLQRPDYALAEVIPFWISIAVLVFSLGRISASAGWLLAPYLLWVAYAATVNAAIVWLNGPFGTAG